MFFARILRHLSGPVDEDLLSRNALLEAQVRELLRQRKKPLRITVTVYPVDLPVKATN